MYPEKFVVPRGTFSVTKAGLTNSVALCEGEKPKAWLMELESRAEEQLKTQAVSGKGPSYGALWFWKTVRHFASTLLKSNKPVCTSETRKKMSKESKHFNDNAYDTALRYLFKIR